MLSYIYWDPSPVAFHLLGWPVRWYALCWCCALLLGYVNVGRLYKRQGIPEEIFSPLFIYCFVGVLVGARLGHCLFYEPGYYLHHLVEMLLPIKRFADGWHMVGYEGLSSHGGVIGLLIAIWLYVRKTDVNLMRVLDNMGIAVPISAAFIRLGNLFNSEIVGQPTDLPWGFIFAANGDTFARHPAQLYESLFYMLVFIAGLLIYHFTRKRDSVGTGFFFGFCLATIFTFRFFIEFLKADQVEAEAAMVLNIGQLLSLPLVVIGFYCMAGGKWCRKFAEKPGAPKYRPLAPQAKNKKK